MASFKMYSTAAVALILASIFSTNALSDVPVLLWESSKVGENGLTPAALSAMDVEEFGDVLMRRLDGKPVVALFLENSLSVEDLSKRSSFPALQSMKGEPNVRLEFIPAVQTPVKALNRLSKLGYEWEKISGEALPEAGKKILVVNLGDLRPDEDRSEMLLRHDKAVASLLKQMTSKYSDVLAVYTGSHSSWTAPEPKSARVRRDVDPTSAPSTACDAVISSPVGPNQIMLYTSDCPSLTVNKTEYSLNSADTSSPVDVRKESQRFVVRYKLGNSSVMITLRFRFNLADAGYWNLSQVEYENSNEKSLLDSKTEIKAPLDISYSCGREAIFQSADGDVILRLKNIVVQPGVQDSTFAPSLDCISFFTIPIWSGLFVTFLLLFIIAWGVDMMMNIHTMDRFDDPKGKPLVFNAQE